jgi:hypothetical protein
MVSSRPSILADRQVLSDTQAGSEVHGAAVGVGDACSGEWLIVFSLEYGTFTTLLFMAR